MQEVCFSRLWNVLKTLVIFSSSVEILYVDFVGVRSEFLFFFCSCTMLPHMFCKGKKNMVGWCLTSGFLSPQPIRCLLHRPVEWFTCTVTTALRRAPAASSPTAPWHRPSSASMDTVMLSSSSSLSPVGTKPVCLSSDITDCLQFSSL